MASRGYSFFARRDEAVAILEKAVDELRLVLITDEGGFEPLEVTDIANVRHLDPQKPARLEIATTFPTRALLREEEVTPGKWGWVTLDLPQERDGQLLMATVGTKTVSVEGGHPRSDEIATTLFNTLKKAFKSHSQGRLTVRNVVTNATGPATGIGILPGGMDWVEAGGHLRQEGVLNIAFELDG
jgi:hypothetical protein